MAGQKTYKQLIEWLKPGVMMNKFKYRLLMEAHKSPSQFSSNKFSQALDNCVERLKIKKENGHYDVTIIDLKSGWQNYYVLQLICYGMMERHNLSTEYFIKMGTVSKTGKTGN